MLALTACGRLQGAEAAWRAEGQRHPPFLSPNSPTTPQSLKAALGRVTPHRDRPAQEQKWYNSSVNSINAWVRHEDIHTGEAQDTHTHTRIHKTSCAHTHAWQARALCRRCEEICRGAEIPAVSSKESMQWGGVHPRALPKLRAHPAPSPPHEHSSPINKPSLSLVSTDTDRRPHAQ